MNLRISLHTPPLLASHLVPYMDILKKKITWYGDCPYLISLDPIGKFYQMLDLTYYCNSSNPAYDLWHGHRDTGTNKFVANNNFTSIPSKWLYPSSMKLLLLCCCCCWWWWWWRGVGGLPDSSCPSVYLQTTWFPGHEASFQISYECCLWQNPFFSAVSFSKLLPGSYIGFFGFWTLILVWPWISSPDFTFIYSRIVQTCGILTCFNPLRIGDVYMYQWTGSSLVQVMIWWPSIVLIWTDSLSNRLIGRNFS